jgi:outer membrane protein assembly factor BamD
MQKFRLLFLFLSIVLLLSGCGEYNRVLNKGKNTEKYKLAVEMYEQGEYKKCIPLFEKLVGPYANKPQMERIQYMISDCYFQNENYSMAAYYFGKFITNYPESSKVQEAAYLGAKSHFLAAPLYSRDQEDTYEALTAYQNFIDKYPNSELIEEANADYDALNKKLEKKDYEIAWQYYHREHYSAAIMAFDIFNEEHLASEYKEKTLYYRFKSAYYLGLKSVLDKKEERISEAILSQRKFQNAFPESELIPETEEMVRKLQAELLNTREQLTTISENN